MIWHFLAQTANPTEQMTVSSVTNALGVPGLLAIISWTFRKIFLWAVPHAERIINAHIDRQSRMAVSAEKLTDATIDIQNKVLAAVEDVQQQMKGVCKRPS